MAIRITLECGHASVLRVRTTPEGYTHDWEVFVRGVDNADISQYIEKVVFQLHETFPKPKRILKEPPYVVKESGYAGFVIPIYICFKNKDEPKRIQILYDLQLQQSGPAINNFIRQSEIFTHPTDDFRRKLLKGGGVIVSNSEEGSDKGDSKIIVPMVGKPKLSGSDGKKHRIVEPKTTDAFADLFGTPIKTAKVSPENKKILNDKQNYHKSLSDKSEKLSKTKHSPHKDSKREKNGEEKKEKRERDQSKDKERIKEKSKRPTSPSSKNSYQSPSNKRPQSPTTIKKQLSPPNSINIRKSASPKIRDKDHKKMLGEKDKDREKEKTKESTKIVSDESKGDKKKKKHREEKDSERKDRVRDKEREKLKELKNSEKKSFEKIVKHDKPDKEKSQENKLSKDVKKSPKLSKESERSNSKTRIEKSELSEKTKDTTRSDKERQKHKHRKKEKKDRTDENKDKEKRDKRDKQVNNFEKDSVASAPPTLDPPTTLLGEVNDRDSSDSANSADEEDSKNLTSCKTDQEIVRNVASDSRLSRPLSPSVSEHVKKVRPEKIKKDKSKSLKSEERDNRKRKKRSDSKSVDDELPSKREKNSEFSPPLEPVSSSQSPVIVETSASYTAKEPEEVEHHAAKPQEFETETEHIAPDSTNSILVESENDEPLVFSEDYVSQLKDLQQKIMTLQDNQELQRVVQVIAATGQYEITRKTFDFDLCALDRRTVQRLQQFFSAS